MISGGPFLSRPLLIYRGPPQPQNLVVKFDGEICGGVLVENVSDDFHQQRKLENHLPNCAGSSPPIRRKLRQLDCGNRWCLDLWVPGKIAFFLQETLHAHKIPRFSPACLKCAFAKGCFLALRCFGRKQKHPLDF